MGIEICGRIDKINGKGLSYKEFVERYMEKNQPVVLTGLMDDWKACSDWVDENGQPNLGFFSTHFGKSRVQVLKFLLEDDIFGSDCACSICIYTLFCLISFEHDALIQILSISGDLFSGISWLL